MFFVTNSHSLHHQSLLSTQVATIAKKWMGCFKETLTDADNFVIDFSQNINLSTKVVFIFINAIIIIVIIIVNNIVIVINMVNALTITRTSPQRFSSSLQPSWSTWCISRWTTDLYSSSQKKTLSVIWIYTKSKQLACHSNPYPKIFEQKTKSHGMILITLNQPTTQMSSPSCFFLYFYFAFSVSILCLEDYGPNLVGGFDIGWTPSYSPSLTLNAYTSKCDPNVCFLWKHWNTFNIVLLSLTIKVCLMANVKEVVEEFVQFIFKNKLII